jgi:hypothetical protein
MRAILPSPACSRVNAHTCHKVAIGSSVRLSDGKTQTELPAALCFLRSINSSAAGANGALCVRFCLVCAPGFIQDPGSVENCSHRACIASPGLQPVSMMRRTQSAALWPGYRSSASAIAANSPGE